MDWIWGVRKGVTWVFGLSNRGGAVPVAEGGAPAREAGLRRSGEFCFVETPFRLASGEDTRAAGHTSLELKGAGRVENTTGNRQQQEVEFKCPACSHAWGFLIVMENCL